MSTAQTLEVPGYQVVQFIGSGARSTIWEVRDVRTGDSYALKRVVRRHGGDEKFLRQAENEYEVGSSLDHEGIRHIFRINRLKKWLQIREIHLLMELCEGVTVQTARPSNLGEILRIFSRVAAALAYMNSMGFVHADMKPNNILLAPDGGVKIIDLGQSCRIGTIKERIQGTPDFIAPEQVYRRPLDARTDVYNLGAALYWTLTGRPITTVLPKKGNLQMKSDLHVKPPDQINADVPKPLSNLVIDCVDMHPANRPSSMKDVTTRLELIAHTINRGLAQPDEPSARPDKRAPGDDGDETAIDLDLGDDESQ
jgi:serine/threonine-protein kinase